MDIDNRSALMRWGLAFVAVAGASSWFLTNLDASDMWWHLAAGRDFFARGALPRHDPFSFTAEPQWINHEWLWGVVAFAAYRIDPELLAWGNFALLGATFWITYEAARSDSESPIAATLATWLAAASAHWYFDVRPQLVTLCFSLLILGTRRLRLAPLLWPPTLVLWCNLHAGHAFGLGEVGLLVLLYAGYARFAPGSLPARTFERWGKRAPWISLALCFVALAVNPWGAKFLQFAASYAPGSGRSVFADEIVEWQPFGWSGAELRVLGLGWLGTFRGRFACVVALALPSALWLARRDAYPVLLALLGIAMALFARRFVELGSLLCAPLVACSLARAGRAALAGVRQALHPQLMAAALLALACAVPILHRDVRLLPSLFARWTHPDTYPAAALRYLRALDAPKRVFNYEIWGGYQMFHAPGKLVFFDGRASTVFGEALYADYLQLINGRGPVAQLIDKYRIEAVLVPPTHLIDVLLALPKPWHVVYQDAAAVLLLPGDSPALSRALPAPERLLAHEPQWLQRTAAQAMQRGDARAAMAALRKALERDPFFVPAYTDLLMLIGTGAPLPVLEGAAADARALLPHRAADFAYALARVCERRGDRACAARAYRRAYSGGPLVQEEQLLAAIEAVLAAPRVPQVPQKP